MPSLTPAGGKEVRVTPQEKAAAGLPSVKAWHSARLSATWHAGSDRAVPEARPVWAALSDTPKPQGYPTRAF